MEPSWDELTAAVRQLLERTESDCYFAVCAKVDEGGEVQLATMANGPSFLIAQCLLVIFKDNPEFPLGMKIAEMAGGGSFKNRIDMDEKFPLMP